MAALCASTKYLFAPQPINSSDFQWGRKCAHSKMEIRSNLFYLASEKGLYSKERPWSQGEQILFFKKRPPFMPRHQKSGGVLCYTLWNFEGLYLVRATPLTVSGRSFWNFTHAFRMVWRYANCVFQNPEIVFFFFFFFFITFYCIFNLDFFFRVLKQLFIASLHVQLRSFSALILQKCIGNMSLCGGAWCMACRFI